jgi:hypothetical protein
VVLVHKLQVPLLLQEQVQMLRQLLHGRTVQGWG